MSNVMQEDNRAVFTRLLDEQQAWLRLEALFYSFLDKLAAFLDWLEELRIVQECKEIGSFLESLRVVEECKKIGPFVTGFGDKLKDLGRFLNSTRFIYLLFGFIVDAPSLSYSVSKFFCDLYASLSPELRSADIFHEWLSNPIGLSIIISQTVVLMVIAALGNYFKVDDKSYILSRIAITWLYLREVLKAIRNTKGILSFLTMVNILMGNAPFTLNYLYFPVALYVALFNIVARLMYKRFIEMNKSLQEQNRTLMQEVLNKKDWGDDQEALCMAGDYLSQISTQSAKVRMFTLILACIIGVVDSIYYYMGALTVSALSGMFPLYIVIASVCLFYTAISILSRINEEYEHQCRSLITAANLEFAVYGQMCKQDLNRLAQELALINTRLAELKLKDNVTPEDQQLIRELEVQKTALTKNVDAVLYLFTRKRTGVQELMKRSWLRATLSGVMDGLSIYSIISGYVFFLAILSLAVSGAVPPIFIALSVLSGLFFLSYFVIRAMCVNSMHEIEIEIGNRAADEQLTKLRGDIVYGTRVAAIDGVIDATMQVKTAPISNVFEWSEVFRVGPWGSGGGKGMKSVTDLWGNFAKDQDIDGHFVAKPLVLAFALVCVFITGIISSLRNLARGEGIGKMPVDLGISKDEASQEMTDTAEENTVSPTLAFQPDPQSSAETIPDNKSKISLDKPASQLDQHTVLRSLQLQSMFAKKTRAFTLEPSPVAVCA